jgi:two-component system OmpR family response regulator
VSKLLLFSADEAERDRLSSGLAPRYVLTTLKEPKQLAEENLAVFDVVLIDSGRILALKQLLPKHPSTILIGLVDRNDPSCRALALEQGVSDCVSAGVSIRELSARITGLLRRQGGSAPGLRGGIFGAWLWDKNRQTLHSPQGHIVPLSPGQIAILLALVERPERVLTRHFLLQCLPRKIDGAEHRSVDVAVARLRRRLALYDPSSCGLIRTARDEGYRLGATIISNADRVVAFAVKNGDRPRPNVKLETDL